MWSKGGKAFERLLWWFGTRRREVPYFIPRVVKEPKFMARNTISKSGMCERVMVEKEGDSFEGAVVVSPTTGFYTDAVSCLDFASLYPSIMRALNMSYETLVSKETVARMKWDQLKGKEERKGVRTIPDFSYVDMFLKTSINEDSPTFVSKSVRKGCSLRYWNQFYSSAKQSKRWWRLWTILLHHVQGLRWTSIGFEGRCQFDLRVHWCTPWISSRKEYQVECDQIRAVHDHSDEG